MKELMVNNENYIKISKIFLKILRVEILFLSFLIFQFYFSFILKNIGIFGFFIIFSSLLKILEKKVLVVLLPIFIWLEAVLPPFNVKSLILGDLIKYLWSLLEENLGPLFSYVYLLFLSFLIILLSFSDKRIRGEK